MKWTSQQQFFTHGSTIISPTRKVVRPIRQINSRNKRLSQSINLKELLSPEYNATIKVTKPAALFLKRGQTGSINPRINLRRQLDKDENFGLTVG